MEARSRSPGFPGRSAAPAGGAARRSARVYPRSPSAALSLTELDANARSGRRPEPRRTTRAGAPITISRAPTSRVTTAPAATNASAPISTPGTSTTPPPTRQARRKVGPCSGAPPGWRPIVLSFVVNTPGPRNTSSSTHRAGGDVHPGLDQHARRRPARRSRPPSRARSRCRSRSCERSRTCA